MQPLGLASGDGPYRKGLSMKIEKYLKKAGVPFEVHKHGKAFTAQELAHEEHVTGHAVAKSVVVQADDRCVLCVLPASFRVDLPRLAGQLGANACKLADEPTLTELFPDVEVGAEPPFGNLYDLTTVVDQHLAGCEAITFSAGTYKKAIRMAYADYAKLVEPTVMDFALAPD